MRHRFGILLVALASLAALSLARASTAPVHATGTVEVWVGYADSFRANPTNFPTPWAGDAGVTFEGCTGTCTFDAGAVRIVNNTSASVTVDSVAVHVDGCTFTGWNSATLTAGSQLIVTQLRNMGFAAGNVVVDNNGCVNNNPANNMDTSDVGPGGIPYAGNCTPDGIQPTVDVTIGGVTATYTDSGRIINTGGYDSGTCGASNESIQWTQIGSNACPGGSLILTPNSQSHPADDGSATVTATFTNSCGNALQGATVHFSVTSGPNAGSTGTSTTNTSGQATFSYSSTKEGTDTVQASITNAGGTITSNSVTVIWSDALISAQGTTISTQDGTPFSGTVATFTDPDTSATASQYTATITWGDGSASSTGSISGGGGSFTVSGSHTYGDDGTYPVTVTISDSDNANNSATANSMATVADQAISATGTTIHAMEGAPFSGTVATFSDPNTSATAGEYAATIDWGVHSGTSNGAISGGGGSFSVNGSHTYADEGKYTITVSIADTDNSGNSAAPTSTAQVADATLTAACATPPASLQNFNGKVATFTDANSGATTADFTATINWGDNSSSAGTVSGPTGGPFTVSGSHTYSTTGSYTISVSITDDGGSTASACGGTGPGGSGGGTVAVFAFSGPGGGGATGGPIPVFVVGDKSDTGSVYFWGSEWAKNNSLSGGSAPNAFKGFANNASVDLSSCSGSFTTSAGNSSGPPAGPLPALMGVIVSGSISQSGSTISGTVEHIIVVQTNAGYANDPGHPGTGTVVATAC